MRIVPMPVVRLDCLMFCLSDDILLELSTRWMSFATFVRFDAAVCNRALRLRLTEFAFQNVYISPHDLLKGNAELEFYALQWALQRTASITDMVVTSEVKHNHRFRRNLLQTFGKGIRFVKFEDKETKTWFNSLVKLLPTFSRRVTTSSSAAFTDVYRYCPHLTAIACNSDFDLHAYDRIGETWPDLIELFLGKTADDACLHALAAHCSSIRALNIDDSQVTVRGLTDFTIYRGQSLRHVQASFATISIDPLCRSVGQHCPQLHGFNVLGHIENLISLETLLQGCPHLHSLHISCHHLGNAAVQALSGMATELMELCISSAYTMTENVLIDQLQCRPQLTGLHISGGVTLTDATAQAIGHCQPNLQQLHLHHSQITDVGLVALALGCPELQLLYLPKSDVSDTGFLVALLRWHELTELSISGCVGITDTLLVALPLMCPGLTELQLVDCVGVTMVGVCAVIGKCAKLRNIVVSAELKQETKRAMAARLVGGNE